MIITKFTYYIWGKKFYKIKVDKIKKYQRYSVYGLSFMHGAQDGQKFIGLVILYMYIVKGTYEISSSPFDNIWIIILVSIIMFLGVSVGGKRIVENIGNNAVKLDNVKGVFSDISTVINLLIASLWGLPVSTTHVKTMTILTLGESKSNNKKSIINIFKAWMWTFPGCLALSYLIAKILVLRL